MRAGQTASNLIMTANSISSQWPNIKANGLPAQGNQPAIAGADVIAALGTANCAILDAMAAANPQT